MVDIKHREKTLEKWFLSEIRTNGPYMALIYMKTVTMQRVLKIECLSFEHMHKIFTVVGNNARLFGHFRNIPQFFSNVVHYGAIMDAVLAKFALWLQKYIENTIFHDIKSFIDTTW